jgi:protein-export chaperone SecB
MNYYRWFSTDEHVAETIEEPRLLRAPTAAPNLILENVKRATFRVPNGYILSNLGKFKPHVEIDFDVSVTQLNNERTLFEVILRSRVGAKKLSLALDDRSITGVVPMVVFETDVTISGVFEFTGISPHQTDRYLQHECPYMLFPRARKAIAALTRNMGYSAIWIDRSLFIQIRERKLQKAQPNVPGTGNA